jgi:hypothetical protein
MPLIIELNEETQILVTTLEGKVTVNQFFNYFKQITGLVKNLDHVKELVILSKYSNTGNMNGQLISQFIKKQKNEINNHSSWTTAFVTQDDKFCLSHLYKLMSNIYLSKELIDIFSNEKNAMKYLLSTNAKKT